MKEGPFEGIRPKEVLHIPVNHVIADILWMDEILHHLRIHGKPLFVGTYRESDHSRASERWCLRKWISHPSAVGTRELSHAHKTNNESVLGHGWISCEKTRPKNRGIESLQKNTHTQNKQEAGAGLISCEKKGNPRKHRGAQLIPRFTSRSLLTRPCRTWK